MKRLALASLLLLNSCSREVPTPVATTNDALFRGVAEQSGLVFQHFNGATGDFYLPEIVGSGVALFDYDGDGDLDVVLVQGNFLLPTQHPQDAKFAMPAGWKPGSRLFRNELIPSGKLHFTDVTEGSGIRFEGMGMGAAVADYDNDGYPDLLITGFGRVALFHNEAGSGTFRDVTKASGAEDTGWITSASFADYDRDGRLDLFLTHYLEFTFRKMQCSNAGSEVDYCPPETFRPAFSRLLHNEGGGRFRDVSKISRIGLTRGPGLGVISADLNADGWPDFYVANDSAASHFWRNVGNGTFVESGLTAGVAFGPNGEPQAGMGISAGDFDNDGDDDLLKTNLTKQGSNLYRNNGKGIFNDDAAPLRMYRPTAQATGFGAGWFDYDNDGWLDAAIANGAVYIIESQRGQPFPYRQARLLLHNQAGSQFGDVSERAGKEFQLPEVSRSIAFGDIDNDGRVDMLITNNNGPARLFLNQSPTHGHWLRLRFQGVAANRDGIGAYVSVTRNDGSKRWHHVSTDGGFLSANDVGLHVGLGESPGAVKVAVQWPDPASAGNTIEEFEVPQVDRTVLLKQGLGRPRP